MGTESWSGATRDQAKKARTLTSFDTVNSTTKISAVYLYKIKKALDVEYSVRRLESTTKYIPETMVVRSYGDTSSFPKDEAKALDDTDNVYMTMFNSIINYIKSLNASAALSISVGTPVTASLINNIHQYVNNLQSVCICDCNYCTCECDYCTCNCNYCTCNCNYCTCYVHNKYNFNRSCWCHCNYEGWYCGCQCNYCICNCAYCTCQCNYCTCQCNYCTCNCNNRTCNCQCNYCTCQCNYCTCNTYTYA